MMQDIILPASLHNFNQLVQMGNESPNILSTSKIHSHRPIEITSTFSIQQG